MTSNIFCTYWSLFSSRWRGSSGRSYAVFSWWRRRNVAKWSIRSHYFRKVLKTLNWQLHDRHVRKWPEIVSLFAWKLLKHTNRYVLISNFYFNHKCAVVQCELEMIWWFSRRRIAFSLQCFSRARFTSLNRLTRFLNLHYDQDIVGTTFCGFHRILVSYRLLCLCPPLMTSRINHEQRHPLN